MRRRRLHQKGRCETRVSVVNYGAGNLYSIQAALRKEGVSTSVTKGSGIERSDAVILPGVGSFNQATKVLPMGRIKEYVKAGGPLLGVCLGLQLFFASSEEGGGRGLSLFPGRVRRLPSNVKVPQIGWNRIKVRRHGELTEGLPEESWVYYVNSYYPETSGRWVVATSEYGTEYPCLVEGKNVYGTQFHPEKSGTTGRRILLNFLRAVKK